jgi:hypothetical protein
MRSELTQRILEWCRCRDEFNARRQSQLAEMEFARRSDAEAVTLLREVASTLDAPQHPPFAAPESSE